MINNTKRLELYNSSLFVCRTEIDKLCKID